MLTQFRAANATGRVRRADPQTCRPAARRQLSLKTETLSLDRVLERLRLARRPSAIKRKFNFEFINSKEKYEHATHNRQQTTYGSSSSQSQFWIVRFDINQEFACSQMR